MLSPAHSHRHLVVAKDEYYSSEKKAAPYISTKNVTIPSNFNCTAQGAFGSVIVRADLATFYILEQRKKIENGHLDGKDNNKFVYQGVTTAEEISQIIPGNIRQQYQQLKYTARESYIISCAQFGYHLSGWFCKMNPGERRVYLLLSSCHAMAFELHHKRKAGQSGPDTTQYVVHLFYPNNTNVLTRCEVLDLHAFRSDG